MSKRKYQPINYNEYEYEEILKDYFLERLHMETFEDFAYTLRMMSVACDQILKENERINGDLDEVAKYNLDNLKPLLDVCSNMMVACDEYFR